MTAPDHDAFTRLVTESGKALRRYVRRLIGGPGARDSADEIVQEAFLRTYEHRDAVQVPRAFLFSTARNLVWDVRRRRRIAVMETVGDFDELSLVNTEGPVGTAMPLEESLIADESVRLLREAVETLPRQCRAAFTLKVFHGLSYREIGTRLGVSSKTVEKHVARGLHKTHAYLRSRYTGSSRTEQPRKGRG